MFRWTGEKIIDIFSTIFLNCQNIFLEQMDSPTVWNQPNAVE